MCFVSIDVFRDLELKFRIIVFALIYDVLISFCPLFFNSVFNLLDPIKDVLFCFFIKRTRSLVDQSCGSNSRCHTGLFAPHYLLFQALNLQFVFIVLCFEFFILKLKLTIESPKFFFVAREIFVLFFKQLNFI